MSVRKPESSHWNARRALIIIRFIKKKVETLKLCRHKRTLLLPGNQTAPKVSCQKKSKNKKKGRREKSYVSSKQRIRKKIVVCCCVKMKKIDFWRSWCTDKQWSWWNAIPASDFLSFFYCFIYFFCVTSQRSYLDSLLDFMWKVLSKLITWCTLTFSPEHKRVSITCAVEKMTSDAIAMVRVCFSSMQQIDSRKVVCMILRIWMLLFAVRCGINSENKRSNTQQVYIWLP